MREKLLDDLLLWTLIMATIFCLIRQCKEDNNGSRDKSESDYSSLMDNDNDYIRLRGTGSLR